MSALVGEALAVAAARLDDDGAAVLARLGGVIGDDARASAHALAMLDPDAARRRRVEIATAAHAALPANLRMVHGSWIEAALAELPARARTAVASPTTDPVDVWLSRMATASLPPMSQKPRTPFERVLARDPAAIIDWLVAIGAEQMAFAVGQAALSHPPLAAAAARIAKPPRAGALGPQRAAIHRCKGLSLDDAQTTFVVIAARTIAPHLATNALVRLQLVARLPRPLGLVTERELVANAAASLDNVPALAALL